MRLLFILENYWPHVGGMETLMRQLCSRLAARNHEVTVVTRSLPNAPREERTSDGVNVVRIPSPAGRFSFPIAAFPAAARLARTSDVIHTATFSAAPLASLVGRLARKPVVLTVPELWIGKWRTFSDASILSATIFDTLERLIFAFPYDAYVGISKYTTGRLRSYLGASRQAIRTISCGFDPTPWTGSVDTGAVRAARGLAPSDFFILAYGRPGLSKGFRYLIDAFPRIAELVPNARLHLILSDSHATARDLAELKRRADPRIVFESPLPFETLTQVVRSADCVAIPSLAEGFGYTTLEAATSGVPLVVSDTTSIPEVVGGRYQFSQPRDVGSIVRAVERVAHADFLERAVPHFDWDTAIRDYEDVYDSVAGVTTAR